MEQIPTEIVDSIFQFVDFHDYPNISLVSRQFYNVLQNNIRYICNRIARTNIDDDPVCAFLRVSEFGNIREIKFLHKSLDSEYFDEFCDERGEKVLLKYIGFCAAYRNYDEQKIAWYKKYFNIKKSTLLFSPTREYADLIAQSKTLVPLFNIFRITKPDLQKHIKAVNYNIMVCASVYKNVNIISFLVAECHNSLLSRKIFCKNFEKVCMFNDSEACSIYFNKSLDIGNKLCPFDVAMIRQSNIDVIRLFNRVCRYHCDKVIEWMYNNFYLPQDHDIILGIVIRGKDSYESVKKIIELYNPSDETISHAIKNIVRFQDNCYPGFDKRSLIYLLNLKLQSRTLPDLDDIELLSVFCRKHKKDEQIVKLIHEKFNISNC